ncbi:PaaI family thioesterase [Corynebacterium auris]|uniref:PaaI family thioesterase n=1 Tax=Corynebacterium auris TaxID=44750 RepID=UPI0025B37A6D|nr:PaaI family thioesterase [Corynebacterium auris]WJY68023.1 Putative esterase [Corynebacterium auris]
MQTKYGKEVLDTPLSDGELAALREVDSGFSRTIGLTITHVSAKRVEGHIDIGPQHHQPMGLANGGVMASIGETLGSIGAVAAAGAPAVGMSNSTDFLRSVKSGRLEAVAQPVHVGSSTHLWRIEMHHEGKLVALTHLKLMILRQR